MFTLFIFFLSLVPGTIVRTLAKVYTSQLLYVIVAQLIEHLTFNQMAVGSNPTGGIDLGDIVQLV